MLFLLTNVFQQKEVDTKIVTKQTSDRLDYCNRLILKFEARTTNL